MTKSKKKRPSGGYPAVCGDCMELIDLDQVEVARHQGLEYVHDCGRVLVRGRS